MMLSQTPRIQHVIQGQFHVTSGPDDVLSTLLGSCVAACMRDVDLGIGGMNHFLLPGTDPGSSSNIKYGARSMEELVNALLRKGARRHRLDVWLFGGANVLNGMTRIGDANTAFARDFVRTEGFRLMGEDLGGKRGRKVRFHPASGTWSVDLLAAHDPTPPRTRRPSAIAATGEVELF